MPAGARRRRLVLRTPPAPRFLGAPPDRSRRPGRPRWSRTRRSSACRSGGPLPKRRPVSVAVENGLNDLGQPQLGYRRTVGLWRTGPKCGARGALHGYQTTSTILGYLRTPKLHSSSGSAEAACAGGQSSATNCGHFRSKPVRKPVFLVTNIRSAGAAVDVLDPPLRSLDQRGLIHPTRVNWYRNTPVNNVIGNRSRIVQSARCVGTSTFATSRE